MRRKEMSEAQKIKQQRAAKLKSISEQFDEQFETLSNVVEKKKKETGVGFNKTPLFPWPQILTEYITGYIIRNPGTGDKIHVYPTLDELAEKYGCSPYTIKQRSSKEHWGKRRELFQIKMQERHVQEANLTFGSPLSDSASTDARVLVAVDKLLALVDAYFEQYEGMEFGRDGVYRLQNIKVDEDNPNADVKQIKIEELKGLVSVIKEARNLVKDITKDIGAEKDSPLFNPLAATAKNPQQLILASGKDTGIDDEEENAQSKLDALIEKRELVKKKREALLEDATMDL